MNQDANIQPVNVLPFTLKKRSKVASHSSIPGCNSRKSTSPWTKWTAPKQVRSASACATSAFVVNAVDASVRDTDDNLPILLGMSFLGRIRMEHDQNRLILTGR